MMKRLLLGSSVLIAVLALIISRWATSSISDIPPVIGRNNTVLFISNWEFGLSNVYVATAYALLERHPEVHVHFASFTPMGPRLERISGHSRLKTPSARDIVFHELPEGLSFLNALGTSGRTLDDMIHPPGRAGISTVCRDMTFYVAPWSGEDHLTLYQKLTGIIDEVDPALVVLDVFFRPAIDAARKQNRLHAFLTPNALVDTFPLEQPYGGWLWKYPIMGSGIPYPIPWSRIPENIYLSVRYFYAMLAMPNYRATQKFLKSKGITDRTSFFDLHRPNVPWFTQTLLGASTPIDVIPPNVTCGGPISLLLSTVEEQSPDLNRWLTQAPTVLINLGSVFVWTEDYARAMAQAVADLLLERTDLQVLWKFRKAPDASGATYSDDFTSPLRPFLENGRVKMEYWLAVDPTSLLETGHIVASVHHGGAGGYHEALGAGVPQVALPQWLDHFNFAQLTEYVGVGVWGCKGTSPYWTAECLRDAMLTVVDPGETGQAMREKARRFGELVQSNPGQYIVAREIAKLTASGYGS
ncbi:hypothetical protein F4677DRAFT_454144 [Hypoxylon crocopeplum]|nr:hypothetical protein F4677DRAFT_454144 [Hypoxylon crocopeplum]